MAVAGKVVAVVEQQALAAPVQPVVEQTEIALAYQTLQEPAVALAEVLVVLLAVMVAERYFAVAVLDPCNCPYGYIPYSNPLANKQQLLVL